MARLKVTYTKSVIGYAHDQKRTVTSLGLRRLNQSVDLPDNPAVRGMVFKVRHLVTVEEVAGTNTPAAPAPRRARAYGAEGAGVVAPTAPTTRRARAYNTEGGS